VSDPARQHTLGLVVLLGLAASFVGISMAHVDHWWAVFVVVWATTAGVIALLIRGIR